MTAPIFVRMCKVQDVLGISPDTVRRWEKRRLLVIHKRGRISGVRTDDVLKVLEAA